MKHIRILPTQRVIKLMCINDNLYFENVKDLPKNESKVMYEVIHLKTRLTKGKIYEGYKTPYGYYVSNDKMQFETFVEQRFIELRDFNLNNILENEENRNNS